MKKYISDFHFITHNLAPKSQLEQVEQACMAGVKWIQYRCLDKPDSELVEEINHAASICDDWGVTLLVTDHYHLLDRVDVQGVHIEDSNADLTTIRHQIGDDKTLGASANHFNDVERICRTGAVDYIGCGPFGHTDTKPNDFQHLGIQGYKDIILNMKMKELEMPLMAVGGVKHQDIDALLQTGIYGIAASSAINDAPDPAEAIKTFRNKLNK